MKKKLNKMAGRMHSSYNQIPYTLGGQITNWRIIALQRLSLRNESSEPQVGLSNQRFSRKGDPQSIWL